MNRKLQDIILYVFAGCFLGYIVLRAIKVGFTHDESFTWHYYVRNNFLDIFHNNPPNANNHMLNSLLAKVFTEIFGYNQLVLRLPAILAFILYLWVGIRISKRLKNTAWVVSAFVLINANPYLLDFFALSRGYALAHAFMLLGIYATLRLIETGNVRYTWYAMTAAAFSVFSVSTMIYFFAATAIVINMFYVFRLKTGTSISLFGNWLRMNIPVFTITALTTALVFEFIRKLIVYKQLYYGGNSNFYDNTLISLILGTSYDKLYFTNQLNIIAWFLIAVVVAGWLMVTLKYLKQHTLEKDLSVVLVFLSLAVLFSLLHHQVLGGAYLIFRTSLFFYPLIICVLICLLHALRYTCNGWFTAGFGILLAGIALLHFLGTMNLTHTPEWKYDASTRKMLEDVAADLQPEKVKDPITIGIHWTFEPTINYYRETQHLSWLNVADQNGFKVSATYYYVYESDSAYLHQHNLQIIKRYPISGTLLAKPGNQP
jgi:hypothetical protein